MVERLPATSRIAVDGPSAAGKSVVGQAVARRLGYLYLDTGAMYRAITWLALREGVGLSDVEILTRLADNNPVDMLGPVVEDGRHYTIVIAGQDVTWAIRQPAVEAQVSQVSAVPGVRRALVAQQRQVARSGNVVMVGRDIGTVVLPDADLKVFLVASVAVRASRRSEELAARGQEVDLESILASLTRRDKLDSEREDSPLRPANDAIIIDTDRLAIDDVVDRVISLAEGRR